MLNLDSLANLGNAPAGGLNGGNAIGVTNPNLLNGGAPGPGNGAQPAQADLFSQIMLAFLSQAGIGDRANNMLDKSKYQKMYNDTLALQNQMDASTWDNVRAMALAWAR
jgi:hypothetical protein